MDSGNGVTPAPEINRVIERKDQMVRQLAEQAILAEHRSVAAAAGNCRAALDTYAACG